MREADVGTGARTVWLLRLFALLLLVSFAVAAATDVYPALLVAIAVWFGLSFFALCRPCSVRARVVG